MATSCNLGKDFRRRAGEDLSKLTNEPVNLGIDTQLAIDKPCSYRTAKNAKVYKPCRWKKLKARMVCFRKGPRRPDKWCTGTTTE